METNFLTTLAQTPPGFASLTYTSKGTGETARYTLQLGFSYVKALERSLVDLECLDIIALGETKKFSPELMAQAASEVRASLEKSIDAHSKGQQNADYTKKGQYVPLFMGLNLNKSDGSFQLFGLVQNKVSLVPGVKKFVKSADLTLAKDLIRRELTLGKFREFALDEGTIHKARLNGATVEF
jgi:hypothetical protein